MKHPAAFFRTVCCIALFFNLQQLCAQLDSIHFIPPMHSRDLDNVDQLLYLSTPETTPFPVIISFRHFNPATSAWAYIDSTVTISNGNPATIGIGFTNTSSVLAGVAELNQPLPERGIMVRGPKKFYANLRVRQDAQAGGLTAKGRSGLGTTFRVAHLVNSAGINRSNFIGIIATEDGTQVSISGYDPMIALQNAGSGVNEVYTPGSSITFTLNAGESYVLSAYCRVEYPANFNGLMGSLVTASKPIVVNCGSWWAGHPHAGIDIGIDQVAPLEEIGTNYVLVRGDASFTGSSQNLETPIVVAHYDNTEVFINGNPNPEYTLNAGQYAVVPPEFYVNQQNMYISTSEPVFMYQSLAGGPNTNNAGFNYVPPLSCQTGASVNNIPAIDSIGTLVFVSELFLITFEDCSPVVEATGNSGTLSGPFPVPGSPGVVTYIGAGYTGDLRITSGCSLQVCILGKSGDRGWSSYFSGFGKDIFPEVALEADLCEHTLLVHHENVDTLLWYFNGQPIPPPVPDSLFSLTENGAYTVIGLLSLVCENQVYDTTAFLVDWLPVVEVQTEPAGCTFGEPGSVSVQATGASGNFMYSLDGGPVQMSGVFTDVTPGTHLLQITDSNGCVLTDTATVTEIPVQQITDTICTNGSLLINGVLFDAGHLSDVLIYTGASGCDSALVVNIALNEIAVAIQPENPTLPAGGGIELTLLVSPAGTVPTSVQWLPAESLSCDICLMVVATPATTTTYEALVSDARGCAASASVTVQVLQERTVYTPNVFSPNADGLNDHFTIFGGAEVIQIKQLTIFDRWGGLVFEGTELAPNTPSQGWDGRRRGEATNAGVYAWFARVVFADGAVVEFKGDVALMR